MATEKPKGLKSSGINKIPKELKLNVGKFALKFINSLIRSDIKNCLSSVKSQFL
jgi:hypothetical protein